MSATLYEDEFCAVQLAKDPFVPGHLVVAPKQPTFLEGLTHNQSAYLFAVASHCASLLFEGMKAQGTNIIASNGTHAQMTSDFTDRVTLHIIPRFAEDNLGLLWEMQPGKKEDIATNAAKISSSMRFGDEPKPEKIVLAQRPVAEPQTPHKELSEHHPKPDEDNRIHDLKHRF